MKNVLHCFQQDHLRHPEKLIKFMKCIVRITNIGRDRAIYRLSEVQEFTISGVFFFPIYSFIIQSMWLLTTQFQFYVILFLSLLVHTGDNEV
jgi:hypothetical protein